MLQIETNKGVIVYIICNKHERVQQVNVIYLRIMTVDFKLATNPHGKREMENPDPNVIFVPQEYE